MVDIEAFADVETIYSLLLVYWGLGQLFNLLDVLVADTLQIPIISIISQNINMLFPRSGGLSFILALFLGILVLIYIGITEKRISLVSASGVALALFIEFGTDLLGIGRLSPSLSIFVLGVLALPIGLVFLNRRIEILPESLSF